MAAASDFSTYKLKFAYNGKRTTLAVNSTSCRNPHIQQNMIIFVAGIL